MQQAYINALYDLAERDANVVSLLSDSGTDYDEYFMRDFPKQCFNFGIAEQNKVAAAAGMASCGKIPFVYTSGAFLAYRAYEFIRDDVCLTNANVKIVGMGSGTAWSTLGATHHTTEDISALRALPNLTILSPASPAEVAKVVNAAYEINGPVYIRLGMKGEQELYGQDYEFTLGKNITLKSGGDIAIFSTGSVTTQVMLAAALLAECGIDARVINVHTLKPFERSSVAAALREVKALVSVEEHSTAGGLGSIIADVIALERLGGAPFLKLGIPERFAVGYGTQAEVRAANGLDAKGIFNTIKDWFTAL